MMCGRRQKKDNALLPREGIRCTNEKELNDSGSKETHLPISIINGILNLTVNL